MAKGAGVPDEPKGPGYYCCGCLVWSCAGCLCLTAIGWPIVSIVLFALETDNTARLVFFIFGAAYIVGCCVGIVVKNWYLIDVHRSDRQARASRRIRVEQARQRGTGDQQANEDPFAFGRPAEEQVVAVRRIVREGLASASSSSSSSSSLREARSRHAGTAGAARRLPFQQISATIWALFFDQVGWV